MISKKNILLIQLVIIISAATALACLFFGLLFAFLKAKEPALIFLYCSCGLGIIGFIFMIVDSLIHKRKIHINPFDKH